MEVAENCVAPPPPTDPDLVQIGFSLRSASAPPAWRERVLTSCYVKHMVGLAARTTVRMAAVLLVLQIMNHLSLWHTAVRGVVLVASLRRMYLMRRRSTATVQPWGWPVWPWLMDSPLTPFF